MSLVLDIIKNNKNWEEIFAEKKIKIKSSNTNGLENLRLFMYDIGADFNDPVVCEARGLVIDIAEQRIVSRRFYKFFNYTEPQAAIIDWSTARTQEKVDGSLVAAFYYNNAWRISTNGTIDAFEAPVSGTETTFGDVIMSADNYNDINWSAMNKNHTYVFELVSPLTQIVIHYPNAHLYSTGEVDNETGAEFEPSIGIERPKEYRLRSFEEALFAIATLNVAGVDIQHEGFVVVDGNYNRIKMKTSEYFELHRANSMAAMSKQKMLSMLMDEEKANAIQEMVRTAPANVRAVVAWYQYQMAKVEMDVEAYIYFARHYYEENNFDRKTLALRIKNDKLGHFGFKAIGNELTAKDLLSKMSLSHYTNMIEDFHK